MQCSLVYQFEHSGKVRRAWFKFGFENFYSSLLSGPALFLCAALMSPQRKKQYCPQIEYQIVYIVMHRQNILVELIVDKVDREENNRTFLQQENTRSGTGDWIVKFR